LELNFLEGLSKGWNFLKRFSFKNSP